MILVTGSTGFIGRKLLEKLEAEGLDYRLLLLSGEQQSLLPKGKKYDLVLSSMEDAGSLRTAFIDVDTVFYLSGSEALVKG